MKTHWRYKLKKLLIEFESGKTDIDEIESFVASLISEGNDEGESRQKERPWCGIADWYERWDSAQERMNRNMDEILRLGAFGKLASFSDLVDQVSRNSNDVCSMNIKISRIEANTFSVQAKVEELEKRLNSLAVQIIEK